MVGITPITSTWTLSMAAITCATRTIPALELALASCSKSKAIFRLSIGATDMQQAESPRRCWNKDEIVFVARAKMGTGGNNVRDYIDRNLGDGASRCIAQMVA